MRVCLACRLSHNDRGLAPVDLDDHTVPGESVLLNGQSTYAVSSSYKPAAVPPMTTTLGDDDPRTSLYSHGGGTGRLRWGEAQPVSDCPTCADTQTVCNTDDSEVCFAEELVRRKLLLGRRPPCSLAADSQYDRVHPPITAASTEVVMRTFKGLSPRTQSSGPCPSGTICWTSPQSGSDYGGTVERVRIQ